MRERTVGRYHPDYAATLLNPDNIYARRKRMAEAQQACDKAVRVRRASSTVWSQNVVHLQTLLRTE